MNGARMTNWKLSRSKAASKNSESAPAALEVQEICDYVCDFLRESPTDLRVCSLVSSMFTSSAQRHLFHAIDLTNGRWFSTSWTGRATRLCRILDHSPHLICFIRRLIINVDEDVLGQLAQAHLTHVETIVLGTDLERRPRNSALSLAAPLIAAPSVRHLRLLSMVFQNLDALCTLFHQRTSFFDQISLDNVDVIDRTPARPTAEGSGTLQKIMVKGFEIQHSRDPGWLVHPLCPFDLSTLTHISLWCATSPGIIALMHLACSSLHTLRIDAREATSEFVSADFPALKRLDLFSGFGGATPAADLLASISVGSTRQLPLEHLTIRIAFLGTLDDESFLRLDTAIAGLRAPQLRSVHVLVSKTGISWRAVSSAKFVVMVQGLQALFPHSTSCGFLAMSYIDDGIQTDL
ncbi:hypothetical protein DFH08DRAFT_906337 [Mycena albidolilacea]|uniref:Uncharacterized protein n=1 Tax=Mycena albidolilacea TaxID=1033008 RepID=A0AAD7E845_9AGAR|nr:hypothetical protein DFH08DRAFT_906337 [Mycena albidolilacea]